MSARESAAGPGVPQAGVVRMSEPLRQHLLELFGKMRERAALRQELLAILNRPIEGFNDALHGAMRAYGIDPDDARVQWDLDLGLFVVPVPESQAPKVPVVPLGEAPIERVGDDPGDSRGIPSVSPMPGLPIV